MYVYVYLYVFTYVRVWLLVDEVSLIQTAHPEPPTDHSQTIWFTHIHKALVKIMSFNQSAQLWAGVRFLCVGILCLKVIKSSAVNWL